MADVFAPREAVAAEADAEAAGATEAAGGGGGMSWLSSLPEAAADAAAEEARGLGWLAGPRATTRSTRSPRATRPPSRLARGRAQGAEHGYPERAPSPDVAPPRELLEAAPPPPPPAAPPPPPVANYDDWDSEDEEEAPAPAPVAEQPAAQPAAARARGEEHREWHHARELRRVGLGRRRRRVERGREGGRRASEREEMRASRAWHARGGRPAAHPPAALELGASGTLLATGGEGDAAP